jgi:PIN domain nuclease of toxin-antitoxin system
MEEAGFRELPVTALHAAAVRDLPDIHRDPFDRILVAQAMTEPLRLLSDDDNVAKYTDLVIKI